MTTTPLILIFCLVVATCVIAYWSDNLGKKLGKKRISLFGLRPRQTATLLSMASSVGIMLFTLTVLLVFSGSVRNALLYYDQVRADLNQAKGENAAAKRDIDTLNIERATAVDQVDKAQASLNGARKKVRETQAEVQEAGEKLKDARQQFDLARGQLSAARRDLSSARQSRDAARASTNRAQSAASQAKGAQAKAQDAEKRATQQFKKAQKSYESAQTNLTNAKDVLEDKTKELEAVRNRLHKERGNLKEVQGTLIVTQSNFKAAQKSFTTTQKEFVKQQIELEKLKVEQEEVKSQIALARQQLLVAQQQVSLASRILTEPIVIETRTALASATIPSRLSAKQAADALRELAGQARTTVGKSQPPRELDIFAPLPGESGGVLNEAQAIEQLSIYLSQFTTPVSVRVIAARDHIQADSVVKSVFDVVPVRTLYERGAIIAETIVDGRKSDALIFRGLLRLTDEGAARARRLGASPLSKSRDEPFFGEGTNERIFETLRRIGELHKPVAVRLVADDDISTVEPVKVRFEISDAPVEDKDVS